MQRTADTKAKTLHLNILNFFIYVKHDKFIMKLHCSPRWKKSIPLETSTVTADTSKCDHNTKTAMLQQQIASHRKVQHR